MPFKLNCISKLISFVLLKAVAAFTLAASASDISYGAGGDAYTDSIGYTLEDVDVVALKQPMQFRSQALAGTIVSGTQAEILGISDIKDLSGISPNLHIPQYGSRITSSIYMRGIGARMEQPAVGLSIDNVGIINKDAYDVNVADIAKMEVLRGAQSTLFGRNAMAGMISIRTLSPMDFQGWRARAEIASGIAYGFHGGWFHKFSDYFGASLSAGFNHSSGRFINEYNGQKADKENYGQLRFKMIWQPSPRVSVSNVLSSSILRQGGYPYEFMGNGKIAYNDTCFYRRFLINDGLSVNHRLPFADLLSVTTVQHINDNLTLDQDFLPESIFNLTQKKRETAVTQDLMLKGLAADDKYQWLVGVYGFYRHLNMEAPVTFKDKGISRLIEDNRNNANPHYPIKWDERSFPLDSKFILPSGAIALYHESRLSLKQWQFAAGIRFDYERISMRYNSDCRTSYTVYHNPSGVLPMPAGLTPYRYVDVALHDSGHLVNQYFMVSPKLSVLLNFKGKISGNAYASVNRGYKAGGFNTQMFSDVLQQSLMKFMGISQQYDVEDIVSYKPEESWNYEIGAHTGFPFWDFTLDAALFFIDCHNQQVTLMPPGSITGRIMSNAAKTRSFGGEFSAHATPVDGLDISVAYGYTDARFVKFSDAGGDYKGNYIPYAPMQTVFLEAGYRWKPLWMKGNSLILNVNCRGVGDIFWNEANTLKQDTYLMLGARIIFETPKWSMKLWGDNLSNTKYYTFYFKSMGNQFMQRGLPLTLGATFSISI